MSELNEADIAYRSAGGNQVFYPLESKDEVLEIWSQIETMFYSGCGGNFENATSQQKLIEVLERKNIPFRVVTVDEGEKIVCPVEYKDAFSESFREVLFSKN